MYLKTWLDSYLANRPPPVGGGYLATWPEISRIELLAALKKLIPPKRIFLLYDFYRVVFSSKLLAALRNFAISSAA